MLESASWILALLTGSLAESVAIVAVAVVGLMLMWGRIPYRRTLRVMIGCFVLFGAGAIAAGLVALDGRVPELPEQAAIAPPPIQTPTVSQQVYDPYAGAAVPDYAPVEEAWITQ